MGNGKIMGEWVVLKEGDLSPSHHHKLRDGIGEMKAIPVLKRSDPIPRALFVSTRRCLGCDRYLERYDYNDLC